MSLLMTVRPMKPQTTLGMAASSSMTILSVSLSLRAAELGDEDGRAQTERHRDDHGQHRDAERADDQRQHAVAHVGLRGGIPFRAEQELAEAELVLARARGGLPERQRRRCSARR